MPGTVAISEADILLRFNFIQQNIHVLFWGEFLNNYLCDNLTKKPY